MKILIKDTDEARKAMSSWGIGGIARSGLYGRTLTVLKMDGYAAIIKHPADKRLKMRIPSAAFTILTKE